MTIDEAIKIYNDNAEYERTHGNLQGCLEFRQLAEWLRDYKRLKEQEPSGDIISKQTVLDTISELNAISFYEAQEDSKETYYEIRQAIKELLPVKQEPKIGHWIEHPEIETSTPEYLMFYECSECGDRQCFCKSDIHKKRFCGNCGCRMVEPRKTKQPEISSYYGLKSYVRERSDKE